jgi:hypothetical protein
MRPAYDGMWDAARKVCGVCVDCSEARRCVTASLRPAAQIWRDEGAAGFSRGMRARLLIHTPSMAISWTTYEAIKSVLVKEF